MKISKRSHVMWLWLCIMLFNPSMALANKVNEINEEPQEIIVLQQVKTLSGIITDGKGDPIIGANIFIKGTTRGVVTDIDGKYTIEVSVGETIAISYIGYLPQEMKISNQTRLDIKLEESLQALDEIVVVGYGTMRKQDLTGSISSMRTSKFEGEKPKNI